MQVTINANTKEDKRLTQFITYLSFGYDDSNVATKTFN